jgi:hypothetical protein
MKRGTPPEGGDPVTEQVAPIVPPDPDIHELSEVVEDCVFWLVRHLNNIATEVELEKLEREEP